MVVCIRRSRAWRRFLSTQSFDTIGANPLGGSPKKQEELLSNLSFDDWREWAKNVKERDKKVERRSDSGVNVGGSPSVARPSKARLQGALDDSNQEQAFHVDSFLQQLLANCNVPRPPTRDSFNRDLQEILRESRLRPQRRVLFNSRDLGPPQAPIPKPISRSEIVISNSNSIKLLAKRMGIPAIHILRKVKVLDPRVDSHHDFISADVAELLADEFGVRVVREQKSNVTQHPRNPVVCVMGHVDHGKTTLLDALRGTVVAAGEAGGITQSIGAFPVEWKAPDGLVQSVTFLDTPGHALFRGMRARGADSALTDIVVLVVDVNDGIMPQTVESIRLAQRNNIPLVVAISKCDLDGADPQKVRRDLSSFGVVCEEEGGDTLAVAISAKTHEGLDKLKDAIRLTAEMTGLKAAFDALSQSFVVESRKDPKLGPLVNVIVRNGTLKVGDFVVCGNKSAKVRALYAANGTSIESAPPSTPVAVWGFEELDGLSNSMTAVATEQEAKDLADAADKKTRAEEAERLKLEGDSWQARDAMKLRYKGRTFIHDKPLTDEEKSAIKAQEEATVSLLLKADVQGSLEAFREYLNKIPQNEVKVEVVKMGVGPITEKEIDIASSVKACICSFGMKIADSLEDYAQKKGVKLVTSSVVYHLMDEIRGIISEKLPPMDELKVKGVAKVLQIFPHLKPSKFKEQRAAAGLRVESGELAFGDEKIRYRIRRGGKIAWEGVASSLRVVKDEVKVVEKGKECGLMLAGFNEYIPGDIIECFTIEQVKRVIDDSVARGLNRDVPDHLPHIKNKRQVRPAQKKSIEIVDTKFLRGQTIRKAQARA